MNWKEEYKKRLISAGDAAKLVKSKDNLYFNGATSLPTVFLEALIARRDELEAVTLVHPMRQVTGTFQPDYVDPGMEPHFHHISEFSMDLPVITAIREGRADYRPAYPTQMVRSWSGPDFDYGVSAASSMDQHGFFTFGAFNCYFSDYVRAGKVKKLILEVNENQPRVLGDMNRIHISEVYRVYEANHRMPIIEPSMWGTKVTSAEEAIGHHVADMIEDGATIQMGPGGVPFVITGLLKDKRDLGVHTESIFDALIDLYEVGAITNKKKTINRGKMICCMAMGSQKTWDFLNDNPVVEMASMTYTNNPFIIAQNYKQVSINATLQVDLTGQCASVGVEPPAQGHYSGVGGQWEFTTGAYLSEGGKAFITFTSTTKGGTVSRIVPLLGAGTPVTISRNDIHYAVTEYGVALLKGKTLSERAKALIAIAHPDFRTDLKREAQRLKLI